MCRTLFLLWTTSLLLLQPLVHVHGDEEAVQEKRGAPSGFTGVRGKKSIPDAVFFDDDDEEARQRSQLTATDEADDAGAMEKRAPAGFLGMRGKKEDFGANDGDLEKRGPAGFLGMRGKKDADEVDEFLTEKRTPSGFMGMRGKKYLVRVLEKRVPNGFMGMRGKKTLDLMQDIKRAQLSGFYGVRGKKQPSRSSFFGMRGKKYPYQFRGKFVGVRGKKSVDGGMQEEAFPENGFAPKVDLNQLLLLLTANDREDSGWGENGVDDGYGPEFV